MSKKLMLGNEAVARGLFEAGCKFVSSYPGTPSTEITEYAAEYKELHAEWAPNEKVAVEAAFGASTVGVRAFSAMKHVGLNVAADPLFTSSYIGVNGGFVIAVADDQGMHSSQNEQDSRHYARAAKMPMLEPADSAECLAFTKAAYDLSEEYDTPVLLRLSTRVSHSQSLVETGERQEIARKPYEKDVMKRVMMPAMAKRRHTVVEARQAKLQKLGEETPLNRVEYHSRKLGILSAGIAYQYAKEAFGEEASYLKLGLIWPLPEQIIRDFAAQVDRLIVVEELDDFLETHLQKLGIPCEGKSLFTLEGEYSPELLRNKVLGLPLPDASMGDLPARPPVLCPGCPHRGTFFVLKEMGLTVSGDIGCYTLGAAAPLQSIDLCLCMGASVSALHGITLAGGEDFAKKSVAVIGDSTFMHSGITGLMNIVYNQSPSTVLILDNSITGMTGHQQNPGTGLTLQGKEAPILDIAAVCRAVGVRRVREVDPYELKELKSILKEELEAPEPSVVIVKRPCVLLPKVKRKKALVIDPSICKNCKRCMKIACPAIHQMASHPEIDPSLCVGCGLCRKMCSFDAISQEEVQ